MINSTGSAVEIIGKEITGVRTHDGPIYVPLKALCAFLGINYDRQRSKMSNGSAFFPELVPIQGKDGRKRQMLCLPLGAIGDWAATIDPDTVRPGALEALRDFQEQPDKSLRADESQTEGDREKERIEGVYDSLHNMACFRNEFSTWIEKMMKCRDYFPGEHVRKASREEVREFVRRTRSNVRVMQATVDAARHYEKSYGINEEGLIELHEEVEALFWSIVNLIEEVCDDGYGLVAIDHPALAYLAGPGFGAMSHSGLEMIRDFHETIIPSAEG
ncbi:MAG: phage antirepressor N-terminal domain-containing protein [Desulfomonilaceae bacterium]